ncbi:MAG: C4-dicarboxylate transporter DcuC [Vicingaceae bacterium]
MDYIGPLICLVFIVIVGRLLLKKYYPHAVLLLAGLSMIILAATLGFKLPDLLDPTGAAVFDLFSYIKQSFSKTNAGVGLMIMAIGGFVAYIDEIGASDALVKIAMKPLSLLKKYPYITTVCVLPIGQLLFVCIPSAAGLGLLLMAAIYPILINLGVSKLSAVSVITGCTAMGIGPASAITASATTIAEQDSIIYFLKEQIPLVIPLSLVMMVSYYFVNRYFDKKEGFKEEAPIEKEDKVSAPKIYAIIPVLPLILLIVFSEIFSFFKVPIVLDTTTAMFISVFVALIFEWFRKRDFKLVLASLKTFWNGMGNIFKTVVTLIIAADIFAKGLISLGFIDGLVNSSLALGLGAVGIGVIMVCMIFLASMLMGSGNASFFAFAPLVPKIAAQFGIKSTLIILPMNLAASMGRTVSPVAGVLIAVAEISGLSTIQIVKRNLIPLLAALIFLLIYHFI